jgi:hypothetical protein
MFFMNPTYVPGGNCEISGMGDDIQLLSLATPSAFVCATKTPLRSKYWRNGMPYWALKPFPVTIASLPEDPSVTIGFGEKTKSGVVYPSTTVVTAHKRPTSSSTKCTVTATVWPSQAVTRLNFHSAFQSAGALPFKTIPIPAALLVCVHVAGLPTAAGWSLTQVPWIVVTGAITGGARLNDVNVLKKNPPPVVVGGRVGPLLGHPMNPIIESARSTKTNFFILVAS